MTTTTGNPGRDDSGASGQATDTRRMASLQSPIPGNRQLILRGLAAVHLLDKQPLERISQLEGGLRTQQRIASANVFGKGCQLANAAVAGSNDST